jgi:hypothetical protein
MMCHSFPLVGDPIEICHPGYHGRPFTITGVYVDEGHTWVMVWDPCPHPGCTEHSPLSKFPVTAVRPFVSG